MRSLTAAMLGALLLAAPASIAQPSKSPAPPPAGQPQSSPPTGREVDLRPKLVPGKETRYALTIHSLSTLAGKSIEKGDGDQDMRQEIGLRIFVERVDDDGATVKVQYESIKVRIRSPIADVDFDSAAPDKKTAPGGIPDPISDMLAEALKRAAGTTLTLKMDPSGAITSVTGGETLDIGSSIGIPGMTLPGGGAGGQGLEWLAGGLGGGGGGAGIRHVGERWTTADRLAGTPVGDFNMSTVHDLHSATAAAARVSFKGRVEGSSMSPANPAIPGMPVQAVQVGPSTYDGDYEWDLRLGELAKMTSAMKVSMTSAGTNGAEGVTMTSDTDMSVERKSGHGSVRPTQSPPSKPAGRQPTKQPGKQPK